MLCCSMCVDNFESSMLLDNSFRISGQEASTKYWVSVQGLIQSNFHLLLDYFSVCTEIRLAIKEVLLSEKQESRSEIS